MLWDNGQYFSCINYIWFDFDFYNMMKVSWKGCFFIVEFDLVYFKKGVVV